MMGPLSGVGDTSYQGVLIPILLAICIDMNRKGTIWGLHHLLYPHVGNFLGA